VYALRDQSVGSVADHAKATDLAIDKNLDLAAAENPAFLFNASLEL